MPESKINQRQYFAVMLISLGSLCGIALIVGAIIALVGYSRGHAAKSWPTVTGKITCSSLVDSTIPTKRGPQTTTWPNIKFQYEVDGTKFLGDRIRFDQHANTQAAEYVGEHALNKQIDVYYNPTDPADSVLEPGHVRSLLEIVGGLGGMLTVCIIAAGAGVALLRSS